MKAASHIGNPDGYQKKGVAGAAKRIVVKRKGIANPGKRGGKSAAEGVSSGAAGRRLIGRGKVGSWDGVPRADYGCETSVVKAQREKALSSD